MFIMADLKYPQGINRNRAATKLTMDHSFTCLEAKLFDSQPTLQLDVKPRLMPWNGGPVSQKTWSPPSHHHIWLSTFLDRSTPKPLGVTATSGNYTALHTTLPSPEDRALLAFHRPAATEGTSPSEEHFNPHPPVVPEPAIPLLSCRRDLPPRVLT